MVVCITAWYPMSLTHFNVDEVNCPRFLFVCIERNNLKLYDYEETISINDIVDAANSGKCPRSRRSEWCWC